MNGKLTTTFGSIITLCLAVMFGLKGMATEMGIIVAAGAICLSFLNIDKIERFKGAGFEAEMKKVVAEANATIEQLREVAATSAKAILTDLMAGNFFDGTTLEKRLELHDQIINSLKGIGASESQIISSDEMWRKGIGVIFHRGIRAAIEGRENPHLVNAKADKHVLDASKEFQDLLVFSEWCAPTSDEMRKFIADKKVINPLVDELLQDYSHFEQNGTFRRRDVFVAL